MKVWSLGLCLRWSCYHIECTLLRTLAEWWVSTERRPVPFLFYFNPFPSLLFGIYYLILLGLEDKRPILFSFFAAKLSTVLLYLPFGSLSFLISLPTPLPQVLFLVLSTFLWPCIMFNWIPLTIHTFIWGVCEDNFKKIKIKLNFLMQLGFFLLSSIINLEIFDKW